MSYDDQAKWRKTGHQTKVFIERKGEWFLVRLIDKCGRKGRVLEQHHEQLGNLAHVKNMIQKFCPHWKLVDL